MKKLILSLVLTAFAVGVQAGDDKAACCKPKATADAKAECPMAKQAKATCPLSKDAQKENAAKQPLQSPKALADARK